MSSQSRPIDPARFALAIEELPIEQIYAKAAELHNQVFHLEKSNEQLREFAEDGDRDCAEALMENEEVVDRVNIRLELLKLEVEKRGMIWSHHGENRSATEQPQPTTQQAAAHEADVTHINGTDDTIANVNNNDNATYEPQARGRLNDEQLATLMRARMAEELGDDHDDDDEEEEEEEGIDL